MRTDGTDRPGAAGTDGRGAPDAARLAEELGAARVEAHDRIGSTNDRAIELARAGTPDWTVVVADEQTEGRGRRGRRWISERGAGLWMSIVRRDVEAAGPLTLIVGLACAEAIEALAPEVRVGIKWPNDLVVRGRKIGGILCEATDGGVVIGVGVNVATAPAGSETNATALEVEMDGSVAPEQLASAIIERLRVRMDGVPPFDDAVRDLAERDVLAGREVETEQAGGGRASGIDATGALLLRKPDGREVRVMSGGVRLSRSVP